VRLEANRAENERQYAQTQEERRKGAARAAAKARWEESPSELESSGGNEEDEEGEIISSPCSLPPPLPRISPRPMIFLVSRRGSRWCMPGEMPPGRCRRGVWPVLIAWSCVGMFHLMGNAYLPCRHVDDLTIWFLVGSLASAVCQGSCIHDCVAVLIEQWG
jgi:hypothetical protein